MNSQSNSAADTAAQAHIQEVVNPLLKKHRIRFFVKREDLLHPHISGNKWRKLKYNLFAAMEQGQSTLLTFGGAYSNHIAAVASAGKDYGFRTIGIIRGEEHLPLNPTLSLAREQGMQFYYMDRARYREKGNPEVISQLKELFGPFYHIPEGGTNTEAVKGCAEITEDFETADFDYICAPCGTGGTLAGIVAGLNHRRQVLGFPVLKGGSFLKKEIDSLTEAYNGKIYHNFQLITDYHFKGYAKWTPELINFINIFHDTTGIPLDPVYTGKMFYGLNDLIGKGYFLPGRRILAIHTGGLQGIEGFNQKFGDLI